MVMLRVLAGVGVLAVLAGVALHFSGPSRSGGASGRDAPEGVDWLAAAADMASAEFDRLEGPWALSLPADHGPHGEAPTEIWQLTAHLEDERGAPVGVQFMLVRMGLAGPDAPAADSPWALRDLYRGHLVLVEAGDARLRAQERFGRGAPGVAGFDAERREMRLDNWSLTFPEGGEGEAWALRTDPGELGVALDLTPERALLRIDAEAAPFRGYAFTRLRAQGAVRTEAGERTVSGVAWFDHLWGELPLPGAAPVASDRLQAHLDDGSEVSVIRSRRVDGVGAPVVDAILVGPDGAATAFSGEAARLEPERVWRDGETAWPVAWRLEAGDLTLDVAPVMDAQAPDFRVSMWSGLVRVEGRRGARAVSGLGTLQLSGYGS
ncbi:MAG: hypothetical protein EA355_05185 [Rhodobacteraceae bacterium]|nr:MAG: hypothetical protein EA355_05185 [Paracoccaceae bacterium]